MKIACPEKSSTGRASLKEIFRVSLFGCLLSCVIQPSSGFAAGEADVVRQMFQACINSGGRPAGQTYNAWVAGGGCICPGSSTGSGQPTCSSGSSSSGSSGGGGMTPLQLQQMELARQAGTLAGQILHDALFGNPQEEAARQAEQAARAAEQRRRADEQARRAEETKARLLGAQSGSDPSSLSLMGVDASPDLQLMTGDQTVGASTASPDKSNKTAGTAGSEPKSAGFAKGFKDASECYAQNAGPYCMGVAADQQHACVTDYRAGYQVGDKQRTQLMQEASRAGQNAGARGEAANAASNPGAQGPCRVQWIEVYNQGYFQGRNRQGAALGKP